MRIPYGFELISGGTLEVNKDEANIVSMIFDFYMAGASLGKVVDMLHSKQISSPTGKLKWTRATVDRSGSEVPIIEQYIAFLIKFRENLKGIQFIEHRAYISEEIQDLQKRKEEVLLREFLEER